VSTVEEAPSAGETLRCARHPNTETVLRCGRCETPICPKCLIATPVGARCPTCAQVKRFAFLVKPNELARAAAFGIGTAAVGSIIVASIGFLGLIGYALMGFLTGEAVSIGANRKRARELGPLAIACIFVGFEVGMTIFVWQIAASRNSGAIGPGLALAPLLMLQGQPFVILGLLLGSLLAWMRVR
jgi:hypothetical protein